MDKNGEILNSKLKDIDSLYNKYPVLEKIDKKNNLIISENAYFKSLYADEYVVGVDETCSGILFVLEGIINIQKDKHKWRTN